MNTHTFRLRSTSWVALRFSGTEPLLRIYAEAPKKKVVQDLLASAMNLAGLKTP